MSKYFILAQFDIELHQAATVLHGSCSSGASCPHSLSWSRIPKWITFPVMHCGSSARGGSGVHHGSCNPAHRGKWGHLNSHEIVRQHRWIQINVKLKYFNFFSCEEKNNFLEKMNRKFLTSCCSEPVSHNTFLSSIFHRITTCPLSKAQ